MNNRIEEIKKDLIEIFDEEYSKRNLITPQFTAEHLIAKGYRKQSEVAREIFEEIEKEVASKIPMKIQLFKDDRDFEGGFINGKTDALFDVLVLIAELKKKYTEG